MDLFVRIILIIFPILMYLMLCCYNALSNRKIEKISFLITILTSTYFSLYMNRDNGMLIILSNIPILICYFKKEGLDGLLISLMVIIVCYNLNDVNIFVLGIKLVSYFITYLILYKRKEFNYLFLKISAIIQGVFISMEYFTNTCYKVEGIIYMLLYLLLIYILTFFSLYLFKLADNISNLYKTVNKVLEENKLKNALFKLTHEIKNPIAVCKGYLDMIDINDKNKSKKYIDIIKGEIDRSLNVIADFMDYSKIKINKEVIDITLLLNDIYESFSLLISSKHIKFIYNELDDEVYLLGDYDRLKQVFVNIIKNSIESIIDNGIIEMKLTVFDKEVEIIISDNGVGMDTETLKNIKEMFYTTKKNGTGLGIALSNEIILAHNGVLEYKSDIGKGTSCIVKLPR